MFEASIKKSIKSVISQECGNCAPAVDMFDGEFTCLHLQYYVVYRARFVYESSLFYQYIKKWVSSGSGSILFERRRYWIDEDCPLVISSLNAKEC